MKTSQTACRHWPACGSRRQAWCHLAGQERCAFTTSVSVPPLAYESRAEKEGIGSGAPVTVY